MNKQDTLRPLDIVVALTLAIKPEAVSTSFGKLGECLGLSSSTTFESMKRLENSGLVRPGSREPNLRELRNFIAHGVKHAFPPELGREVRGIPTAHSGPVLKDLFDATKPIVWPDVGGSVRGTGLTPLYPGATRLASREPEIYSALTLVDAIRVGQARERNAALDALDKVLSASSG
jgi:hypothetical protein